MKKILSFKKKEDEKILRSISKDVVLEDIKKTKIQNIINELFEYSATQADSAGISAVQLGFLKRIFIADPRIFKNEAGEIIAKKEDCVFINPKIIKKSKKQIEYEEGCLSVRGYYGLVSRSKNVTIEYFNQFGEKKIRGAGGLPAILFQHEIDHLDGILFIDKTKKIREMSPEEMKKIRTKEKEKINKNKD